MNGGNMEQYIYRADVWCHNCAEKIKLSQAASTNRPPNPEDETSYDSDVWPKGPYEDQESDSPEHCAGCGLFLENPLTQAGYRYVQMETATVTTMETDLKETADLLAHAIEELLRTRAALHAALMALETEIMSAYLL